ncbi:MerR family transcriptional regulator [Litoribrevibacter albus]|uniref:Liu genes regulator n=1 Tax=Litoribrevibacter albus TaxID=1473156 RepID=A0AA37SCL7_9GAMM|nr:MerR family DNA-binding transcriptional regulator [Litoribrevibacter albus]GLQ32776.1 liu genes regulator [Litoribrevibacter albus]
MSKSKTYSISDLAAEFDITPRAIRFYESEGLLNPEREGQKRIYHQKDYVLLKLILRGKRLGWSLAESKALLDLYDPEERNREQYRQVLEKIEDSRQRLEQQRRDIELLMLELDEHQARVEHAMLENS